MDALAGGGGTKTSGSNRTASTSAAWLTSAGRMPSSIGTTSEPKRAPSCRAGLGDETVDANGVAVRQLALDLDHIVELQVPP